ncbi:hypothetical protein ILFOPFJJ_06473 [Ensifer psoraleae]|nr:hypothetical protein [Sinorhizobium psoraleae]
MPSLVGRRLHHRTGLHLLRQARRQPVLQRLAIGHEGVEVQRLVAWPLPVEQVLNQRPRAIDDEDAAIVIVQLWPRLAAAQRPFETFQGSRGFRGRPSFYSAAAAVAAVVGFFQGAS